MSNFIRSRRPTVKPALLTGLLLAASGWVSAESALDAAAVERLRESTSYLSGLQQFALHSNTSIEIVMLTGQKIQFDDEISATVQRPNKFHAVRKGEALNQELFYDGTSLTLVDADHRYHATVDAPDTLDGMLDFARESLDIVAPGGDFINTNAFEILMQDVQSGFVVSTAVVEGVVCDHLAFSAPGTDWQIWIQQGDKPLPRKIVITSRDIVNAPQFTLVIKDWDLAPDVSDDSFRFKPTGETVSIDFIKLDDCSCSTVATTDPISSR